MKEWTDILPPAIEEDWGDLGVTWTEDKKEELRQAILKVRKLEGLD